MTPFLSTMTLAGHELVASVRNARTAADMRGVMEKYKSAALPAILEGRRILSDADEFAFGCALAMYVSQSDRQRATNWEAAALTALRAKAYSEALVALTKAEEFVRSKERQDRIRLIRELLVARGGLPEDAANTRTRERAKRPSSERVRT